MTATKAIAIIAALGVVASGIYGMTQAGPHLVKQGVSTVDSLKVGDILSTALNTCALVKDLAMRDSITFQKQYSSLLVCFGNVNSG